MSLRNTLEQQKRWLVPLIFVLGVAALGYSVWSNRKTTVLEGLVSRAYYTEDEGKTYFEDDIAKPFPFTRNGKTVYRAYLYRCGPNGKPFLGVIGRQVQAAAGPTGGPKGDNSAAPVEIKKPGTDKWIPIASPDGIHLIQTLCPDGRPDAVLPGEE